MVANLIHSDDPDMHWDHSGLCAWKTFVSCQNDRQGDEPAVGSARLDRSRSIAFGRACTPAPSSLRLKTVVQTVKVNVAIRLHAHHDLYCLPLLFHQSRSRMPVGSALQEAPNSLHLTVNASTLGCRGTRGDLTCLSGRRHRLA